MLPSNEAIANKSGLRGHHSTWKAQFDAAGAYLRVIRKMDPSSYERTSPMISAVSGFQAKVRWSLPQESRIFAS